MIETVFLSAAAGSVVGLWLGRWIVRRQIREFVRLMVWAELIEFARCTVVPRSFTTDALTEAVVDEIVRRESERVPL